MEDRFKAIEALKVRRLAHKVFASSQFFSHLSSQGREGLCTVFEVGHFAANEIVLPGQVPLQPALYIVAEGSTCIIQTNEHVPASSVQDQRRLSYDAESSAAEQHVASIVSPLFTQPRLPLLSKLSPDAVQQGILAESRFGSYFGEAAFMSGLPSTRASGVQAGSSGCTVLRLAYDAFAKYAQQSHFQVMKRLLKSVAQHSLSSLVRSVPLFEALNERKVSALLELLHVTRVPVGTVLCREGVPGDCLYLIVEGAVRVYSTASATDRSATSASGGTGGKAPSTHARKGSSTSIRRFAPTGDLSRAVLGRLQRTVAKGFFVKQGGRIKTWHRRYAVLRGNVLSYYAVSSQLARDLLLPEGDTAEQQTCRRLPPAEARVRRATMPEGRPSGGHDFSEVRLRHSNSVSSYRPMRPRAQDSSATEPSAAVHSDLGASQTVALQYGRELRQGMALNLIGLQEACGPRILKGRFEITGASSWSERLGGFVLHTVQGRDVYCYASSNEDRDEWLQAVAAGVLQAQSESLVEDCELEWEDLPGSSDAPHSVKPNLAASRAAKASSPAPRISSLKSVDFQAQGSLFATRRASVTKGGGIQVDAQTLTVGKGEAVDSGDSEDDDNGRLIVNSLTSGSFFGEAALLTRAPRNATVVASQPCTLLRLSQANFHNFLRVTPDAQAAIQNAVKRRYAQHLMALQVPFLAGFNERKMQQLADRGKLVTFGHGHIVFSQGSTGSSFYVILHGSVAVVIQDSVSCVRRVVSLLRPGSYFGELALLRSTPRAATIVARETTTLLELTQDDFLGLFLGSSKVPASTQVVASDRARKNTVVNGTAPLPVRKLSSGRSVCLSAAVSMSAVRGVAGASGGDVSQSDLNGFHSQEAMLAQIVGMAAEQSQAFADFELRLFKEQAELRHILHHTDGLRLFTEALSTEFSSENVQFWSQVQLFRRRWLPLVDALPICVQQTLIVEQEQQQQDSGQRAALVRRGAPPASSRWLSPNSDSFPTPPSVQGLIDFSDVAALAKAFARVLTDAQALIDLFVSQSAEAQVNLKSSVRNVAESTLGDLMQWKESKLADVLTFCDGAAGQIATPCLATMPPQLYMQTARRLLALLTLFDDAQAEIYDLMNKDNFARFKASPLFKQLLLKVNPYNSSAGRKQSAKH